MEQNEKEFLRSQLKAYVESITPPSKSGKYVCPFCDSGKGKHQTGAFSINDKGTGWKCFSCGRSGDIFDLIAAINRLDPHRDFTKIVDAARKFVGYDKLKIVPPTASQQPPETKPETNYRDFFLQAVEHIGETEYHRGISLETLKQYGVGYCASWVHPEHPTAKPTPRLIIPTSDYSYLARATRDHVGADKMKVGKTHFFNCQALTTATKPIFIVEGEIDALSIIDVGGEAVALGSVANIKKFLLEVQRVKPVQPLIVAMDNDDPGKKAAGELVEGLQQLGATVGNFVVEWRPHSGVKDANDLLQKDREKLKSDVMAAMKPYRDEKEKYRDICAGNCMQTFIQDIHDSKDMHAIPTGFSKLDEALDGGLYEGLYIIGAISSLGKTTLVNQIADTIARDGRDVLTFSLEMARSELMARSISRHTLEIQLAAGGSIRDAKTAMGILCGDRYDRYSDSEHNLINAAMKEYASYADHVYIRQGEGEVGAATIRKDVEKHISFTGNTPLVIVDYLQLLAPYNDRASDKQNMDKATMELKRISRDYKTPVIAISSFNRANYSAAVAMEAFKESGAIEYSSDVLIGLQLEGAGRNDFDVTEAKKKDPREIELVILKNRRGRTGDKISMHYMPKFNYFEEA